ncbi:MAG: hypothetical protein Q4D53_08630, partial [Leptotrichiaceae bacterium]|nr:hypothetical protein [Leptotrichiaceae bacterium]
KLGKGIGDITGIGQNSQNNYPYNVMSKNVQQQKEALKLIDHGLESLLGQLQGVNLLSETGSMSEATRSNAYNSGRVNSEIKSKNFENLQSPFKTRDKYISNYIKELENLNRNNTNKILESYMDSEKIKLGSKN